MLPSSYKNSNANHWEIIRLYWKITRLTSWAPRLWSTDEEPPRATTMMVLIKKLFPFYNWQQNKNDYFFKRMMKTAWPHSQITQKNPDSTLSLKWSEWLVMARSARSSKSRTNLIRACMQSNAYEPILTARNTTNK